MTLTIIIVAVDNDGDNNDDDNHGDGDNENNGSDSNCSHDSGNKAIKVMMIEIVVVDDYGYGDWWWWCWRRTLWWWLQCDHGSDNDNYDDDVNWDILESDNWDLYRFICCLVNLLMIWWYIKFYFKVLNILISILLFWYVFGGAHMQEGSLSLMQMALYIHTNFFISMN